jgi:truncated hemoglobin YjbI
MRSFFALGFVLFAAVPATAVETAAVDKLICDALKGMHNKAADLYNVGDANGCYRMFQGGLITVGPLLAHRPDVQEFIDQGLQAAERQASIPLRAKSLHETIEAVRGKLKPATETKSQESTGAPMQSLPQPAVVPPSTSASPMSPAPMLPAPMSPAPMLPAAPQPEPLAPQAPVTSAPLTAADDTLWKRLGGEVNVNKIVDDFLTWAVIDKKVDFTRGGKYPLNEQKQAELKQKFVAYIKGIASGTPDRAATRSMADVHKGMNITDDQFNELGKWLKTALEKNNVAARDVEEVMRKVNDTRKDIVAAQP